MKITIIGLGYTGTVTGAYLARTGHAVIGVDIDAGKSSAFTRGEPTFAEPGLREALQTAAEEGRLAAEKDTAVAVAASALVVVCVGTPPGAGGRPDLSALDSVAAEIGEGLKHRGGGPPCSLVLRSTVPPGTTRQRFIPLIEETSNRAHGDGWACLYSPEFLREGEALADFSRPPQTIIGAEDPSQANRYLELLAAIEAPVRHTSTEVAEFMKYACNAFHAAKITFANEIGAIGNALGIDGGEVMDLVCNDTVLNISPAYLKPGGPFGGSCLPKDLRALEQLARSHDVEVPFLASIAPANEAQIDRLVDAIRLAGHRQVGLVGLAFKPGTDDLRESPMVTVLQRLLVLGFEVFVHDPHLDPSALRGRNRNILDYAVPHADQVLVGDLEAVLGMQGTLVAARMLDAAQIGRSKARLLIDLVGLEKTESGPQRQAVAS